MTPFRVLLVGLIVVSAVLFVLNPGPEKFKEFLELELAQQAEARARAAGEEVGGEVGGAVSGFLADRLGRRAGSIASEAFEREDYKLASVYTADLNGRRPGGAWKFLGIAGWFVPLERPEASDITG